MDTNIILSDLQRMLDAEQVQGKEQAKQKILMQSALGLLGNALGDVKRIADALEQIALNTQPQ